MVRVPELFLNARGCEMTRAGFAYLLHQHAVTARAKCPVLCRVALWLGHESTQTTEDYLRVDATQRIGALKAVTPPQLRPGTFRPPPTH